MAELRPSDDQWMNRAVALAYRARPSPNPRVGSVVVRDGEAIGEGFHVAIGQDHAEVAAVKAAGDRARGATLYVTLEPCNHHGRTPPCTEALIQSQIARVVIGVRDPNPSVAGGGIERLRAAGITVEMAADDAACVALIRAWRKHVTQGLPYVVLKAGMTLDARIATKTRESRWITGPLARRDAHTMRARADAVLVGIGTVIADDPSLTPRDVPLSGAAPARVVLDSSLRMPLDAALVRGARETPTWILHAPDINPTNAEALQRHGVATIAVARDEHGRVSIPDALRVLAGRGVVELLVEGGGSVHGAMLDARAADAIVCYIAPMLFGGRDAVPAFGGMGVAALSDAHRLGPMAVEHIGEDLKLSAEFVHVHRDHHRSR